MFRRSIPLNYFTDINQEVSHQCLTSIQEKNAISFLCFTAQSNKFITGTFIRSKHKKQGIEMAGVGFTGFCKNYF